jgi:hypothetical protein
MHPTGNPTYTLLTHLFACLPVGDVAHRVNLSSAVFGVLAVAVAYAVGLVLSRQVVAAAAGALVFGVSLGYMRMVEGRREDAGLRRFSGSLEERSRGPKPRTARSTR